MVKAAERAVVLGSIFSPWIGDRAPGGVQKENYRAWSLMGPKVKAPTATYGKRMEQVSRSAVPQDRKGTCTTI